MMTTSSFLEEGCEHVQVWGISLIHYVLVKILFRHGHVLSFPLEI
jgi:hypothetical protein